MPRADGHGASPESLRTDFEAGLSFALDAFQAQAFDALDAHRSVLVAAPTGSGKTLVAEYAIARALSEGSKVFYTTPIKALSNQKYHDLQGEYGTQQVGLLTGDNSVNAHAPIVVMTTEVLRNMIYSQSSSLDGLRYVILDEVHYLQNRSRGPVWEEVIIHLPLHVDLVCLSATVSNAEEFADWIQTVRGETSVVIEAHRPVELVHLYTVGARGQTGIDIMETFVDGDVTQPNPEAARLDRQSTHGSRGDHQGRGRGRYVTPWRSEIIERLFDDDLLPAITFIFSRAGCDGAVDQCVAAGLRLTTPVEREHIRRIAEQHTAQLADDDLDVLGYDAWLTALELGFAAHHAGMVPPMKEAVEEAFAAGLVKAVFATETLALGINMPARTVVIEKISKFTGERHEFLTAGEYTQLAGRAGRRGIDTVGYVLVCWNPFVAFEQVAKLAAQRTYALTSSFRPTYNMAANLVRRYQPEEAHRLLNLSFAQYRSNREVVAIERRLEKARTELAGARRAAHCDAGDIAEYRALCAQLVVASNHASGPTRVQRAIESLKPGDIITTGHGRARVVVLSLEQRHETRVLAVGANRKLVRLRRDDFDTPPTALGHISLPVPYSPRSATFRRSVADRLRRSREARSSRRSPGDRSQPNRAAGAERSARHGPEHQSLTTAIAEHPLHGHPDLDELLRAAGNVERYEREVRQLEAQANSVDGSMARQLDQVLRVLGEWGYVDGWSLTEAGELLAGLYTEVDLLLAQALCEGHFDDITPQECASLMSCFTYERRGPEERDVPDPIWPSATVARRARNIARTWKRLNKDELAAGLPETRAPDPGFVTIAHDWADGEALIDVLGDEELTAGDFVRQCKQIIDLLRQVADLAPIENTRRTASTAAEETNHGVVAISSAV